MRALRWAIVARASEAAQTSVWAPVVLAATPQSLRLLVINHGFRDGK